MSGERSASLSDLISTSDALLMKNVRIQSGDRLGRENARNGADDRSEPGSPISRSAVGAAARQPTVGDSMILVFNGVCNVAMKFWHPN